MGYQLTSLGNIAALKIEGKDPEGAIVVYLYEHKNESVEIDELVGELRSDETTILRVLNRMLNVDSPYIKEV
jgi:hypothetical protein